MRIEPFELRGRFVRLTPMSIDDVDGLVAAASEDRATYGYTSVPDDRDAMAAQVRALVDLRDAGPRDPVHHPRRDRRTRARRDPVPLAALVLRPRRAGRGGDRRYVARGVGAAEPGQHRGEAADAHARVRDAGTCSASTSRPTPATPGAGPRSSGSAAGSTASCAPGSRRSSPARRARARDSALYSIVPSEWPDVRAALEARLAR